MARSIRSKRGRKLRAFKRIRYGEKELARLKDMLSKAAKEEQKTSVKDDENISVSEPQVDEPKDAKPPAKPPKYPSWLSQFKVKKLAKIERKRKVKETKRLKKEKMKLFKKSKNKKSVK